MGSEDEAKGTKSFFHTAEMMMTRMVCLRQNPRDDLEDVGQGEGGEYLRRALRPELPHLVFKLRDGLPVHQEGEAGGQGGPRVLGGHQSEDGQPAGGVQAEGDRHHGVEVTS